MLVSGRRLAFLIAALTVVAAPSSARAQGAPSATSTSATQRGEIRGRVVNAGSTTPVSIATVEATVVGTTTPAARVTVNTDGSFRLPSLRFARYRVVVRALGYAPRTLALVTLGADAPTADVGVVPLTAAPLQLQSQAVTAARQDVQLAPDRNSYVVRDMPATKGGNALDVLRNVPAVDVDIDNVVSLRGNSGVTVQINGRPSPLKAGQLGDFLAQLPADMVDKIEVVSNPSARDDPTGVAGILNIVLKQEADAGTSGSVTVSGATTGHADAGANIGTQHGALTLFGSYNFFHENRPRTEDIFRENLYLDPVTYLDERGLRTQTQYGHTVTGSATYELTKHDELSFETLFTSRSETESNGILYRDLGTTRALTSLSDRVTAGTNYRYNVEATLGQKHAFAEKGHRLSSEVRFNTNREAGPLDVTGRDLALDGSSFTTTDLERQYTLEQPRELSLKSDYVRPLSSSVRLEAGYKGQFQRFHTAQDVNVMNVATGLFAPDSTRISDFVYDQRINGAYSMLSAQEGAFQLQGGLRVEHAATQFTLATRGTRFDNTYNSIFPSALVAWNVTDANQVKLSYSTRIRRPDEPDQLDPTPHFADPLNVFIGNPMLKPEYIRALELGLQRTGARVTMQLTPYWRHTIDAVRSLRTIDTLGVSTRTVANVATNDAYGADANLSLSGGNLTGFAGVSAFKQVSNASALAPGLSVNSFGWRARANAAWHVSQSLDVQALASYQAAMDVEQGRNGSRTQFSMAARQKLVDDRLSLTLRVIDPFDTSHESSTTIDPRFLQQSNRARQIRGLLLSANWSFGKPPKKQRERDDLVGTDTSGR